MKTYYVDYNSTVSGNGLSKEAPAKSSDIGGLMPGDKVLIKKGCFVRGQLKTFTGVYYGTYGEGNPPVFCGSADASDADAWQDCGNNIWRYMKGTKGGAGNFIFNNGEYCGTYRWSKENLREQGDFYDSRPTEDDKSFDLDPSEYELLLYSSENPGKFYKHIEIAVFGDRKLCDLKDGITVDGIRFINSGVHGAQGQAENVTIKNCAFEFIGGCPWSKELRIRFGNAIEFFDKANDITIENCTFNSVYDSCITYQGYGEKCPECDNFICKNNVFDTYGMAAFEYRDKLPMFSCFNNNVCRNAGCGFAMQGEELPRRSEIWPEPMGHHIFLWRMTGCRFEKGLEIKGNTFDSAPVGAAIYSRISKEAEKGIDLNSNKYVEASQMMIAHYEGRDFTDFDEYSAVVEPSAIKA